MTPEEEQELEDALYEEAGIQRRERDRLAGLPSYAEMMGVVRNAPYRHGYVGPPTPLPLDKDEPQ